jgi:hypothetical protein
MHSHAGDNGEVSLLQYPAFGFEYAGPDAAKILILPLRYPYHSIVEFIQSSSACVSLVLL